ncbi:hypothetical protein FDECE_10644 [Fusarium decemcellulare]|nr:hypothetical protein FDECE_10644 [Fusarium decemcellulare]
MAINPPARDAKTGNCSLQARVKVLEQILWLHSIDIDVSAAQLLEEKAMPATTSSTVGTDASSAFGKLCVAFEGILASNESLNFDRDGEARYFGSTSGRPDFTASDVPHAYPQLIDEAPITGELESHLIDLYFKWEQPWFQVVDETLFRESRKSNGRYFSPLLLNCILAMGARYSDRPEVRTDPNDPNTAGRIFLDAAEVLLYFDIKRPTITTLQAVAIMGTVYVAFGQDAAGWLHSGMANRLVLDMGLHLDSGTLASSHVLLEKIILNLYAPKRLALQSQRRRFFESCLLALKSWHYGLADDLKPTRSGVKNAFPQAYTLSMVYNTAILLLTKPYLKELHTQDPSALSDPQQRRLRREDDDLLRKASKVSLEAAKHICSLGDQYREVFGSFRLSPITATHSTLSAVLALITAHPSPPEAVSLLDMDRIESCLKTLQELSTAWTPPKRYHANVLCMLRNHQARQPNSASTPSRLAPNQQDPADINHVLSQLGLTETIESNENQLADEPMWAPGTGNEAGTGGFLGIGDMSSWVNDAIQLDLCGPMLWNSNLWDQVDPNFQVPNDVLGQERSQE